MGWRMIALGLLATGLGLVSTPAVAAVKCDSLVARITPATRKADAERVVRLDPGQKIAPDGVELVMVEGPWRLVWASPENAERGVYFLKRAGKAGWRLADTWGGVMPPDDRAKVLEWAQKLKGGGVSPRMAECFVERLAVD